MATKMIDLGNMSLDELKALSEQIAAHKKVKVQAKKAEIRAKELAEVWGPWFDEIDQATDLLELNERLTKPAAVRIYFDEQGHITRETVRFYDQAKYSGVGGNGNGGNKKPVEVDVDGMGNWQAFKSHAEACRAMGFPIEGNSPVRVLHANLPGDRIRTVTTGGS